MKQFEYYDLYQTPEGIAYHGKVWSIKYKNTIQNLLGALGWELVCTSSMTMQTLPDEGLSSAANKTNVEPTCPSQIIYTYKREHTDDFITLTEQESEVLEHIRQQVEREHLAKKLNTLYKTFEAWATKAGFRPVLEIESKRTEQWIKQTQSRRFTWGPFGSSTVTEILYEQQLVLSIYSDSIRLDISYFQDGKKVHTAIEEFTVEQVDVLKGFELESSEEIYDYAVA
jgi:hypothetical protein